MCFISLFFNAKLEYDPCLDLGYIFQFTSLGPTARHIKRNHFSLSKSPRSLSDDDIIIIFDWCKQLPKWKIFFFFCSKRNSRGNRKVQKSEDTETGRQYLGCGLRESYFKGAGEASRIRGEINWNGFCHISVKRRLYFCTQCHTTIVISHFSVHIGVICSLED